MPNRPAIPAEIAREVLIESGHRCAVCGAGCPLEKAHIIPWHKSREHKAEDLICLCASCHQRADLEKWGEKTLREYKRRPWVMKHYEKTDSKPQPTTRLRLAIDMEVEDFNEKDQRWLQYAIAAFLEIQPDTVRIISTEMGSVKVVIELPTRDAKRLLSAYKRNEPELLSCLYPLVLLDLSREPTRRERILNHFSHLKRREELLMPKDGDTMEAYCGKCEKKTTWVYGVGQSIAGAVTYWLCLGCGTHRQ